VISHQIRVISRIAADSCQLELQLETQLEKKEEEEEIVVTLSLFVNGLDWSPIDCRTRIDCLIDWQHAQGLSKATTNQSI
jgi:hypothetical protein